MKVKQILKSVLCAVISISFICTAIVVPAAEDNTASNTPTGLLTNRLLAGL